MIWSQFLERFASKLPLQKTKFIWKGVSPPLFPRSQI
jgi:hypothetical protein